MRLVSLLVAGNEADRYLEKHLRWHREIFDEIFVYDDQTTDGTFDIAQNYGIVERRPDTIPSFLEHEGRFRTAALHRCAEVFNLRPGEWIATLDADEFLVSEDIRDELDRLNLMKLSAARVTVPEVFSMENDTLWRRVDGAWGNISTIRFMRWKEGMAFEDKPMGCGFPVRRPLTKRLSESYVLHMGYAQAKDVESKYNRYTSLENHGHGNNHIESIPKTPTLEPIEVPSDLKDLLYE